MSWGPQCATVAGLTVVVQMGEIMPHKTRIRFSRANLFSNVESGKQSNGPSVRMPHSCRKYNNSFFAMQKTTIRNINDMTSRRKKPIVDITLIHTGSISTFQFHNFFSKTFEHVPQKTFNKMPRASLLHIENVKCCRHAMVYIRARKTFRLR